MCRLFVLRLIANVLLLTLFSSAANSSELSPVEMKEIESSYIADYYSEEMVHLQNKMLESHKEEAELIMLRAATLMDRRFSELVEDRKKRAGITFERSTLFMAAHFSLMKLGMLAQLLSFHEISACHLKEAAELEAHHISGVYTQSNCRFVVYANAEVKAKAKAKGKEYPPVISHEALKLVINWVNLNMLYSEILACAKGKCI